MKLNRKLVVVALGLSLAVTMMIYYYMNAAKTEDVEAVAYVTVVTAVDTIPAYTEIVDSMLEYTALPSEYVHQDAILSKEDILGGITSSEIIMGEQVLSDRVVMDENAASLSYQVDENMRGITIPITEVTGIAGYAEKGDRIDILVSYTEDNASGNTDSTNTGTTSTEGENTAITAGSGTDSSVVYTQLQNIEILEEGPYSGELSTEENTDISSFTVLVTPEQAEVLAYAIMNGSIQCTLRNPADDVKTELQKYGTENFGTWRDR